MEREILVIKTYIDGINDVFFYDVDNPIEITEYTFNASRMGIPTLSATLLYHVCLDSYWSGNEYVKFRGEMYFIKDIPTSSKDNTDHRFKHEINFSSERDALNNEYYYDVVTTGIDKYFTDNTKVLFYGDISEAVLRLNAALIYSGLKYRAKLSPNVTSEVKQISLTNAFFSQALKTFFETYEIPYYFEGYTIIFGFPSNVITTPFEYGFDNELLSISKQNAGFKVINKITGEGSSENLPFRYPNFNDGTNIPVQYNLMPSVYRNSGGVKKFYTTEDDPNWVYDNPYTPNNSSAQFISFPDIKPTIKEMTNANGERIDQANNFFYVDGDSDDFLEEDETQYAHPYFFMKINKTDGDYGFNLFDSAILTGEMTISMTSGNCAGCNFRVQVIQSQTDENKFYNPVRYENGKPVIAESNWDDDQQDSSKNEITLVLTKDADTFNVLMPNVEYNYKPSSGDTFVILNIELPKAYILQAEQRLDTELFKALRENNNHKFNFKIVFSRIFFAENPQIMNQLDDNSIIQIVYDNKTYELYISSIKYSVTNDDILPDIEVDLVDTIAVSQSGLRKTIETIAGDLLNAAGGGDFVKQGLRYFLRKDIKDVAKEIITFQKGLEIGKYTSGLLGTGGTFQSDVNGKSYAEVDRLYVRIKAYFDSLEIQNTSSVGGRQMITPAGAIRLKEVVDREINNEGQEIIWDYYRCYFVNEQDGIEIENRFKVGDQALSQDFNIKEGIYEGVSNHYYWRLVVGVGDNYIDLSKTDYDTNSDIPKADDIVCQLGNRNDKTRQNAIIISAVDQFSPSMDFYAGIDSYSYLNKEYISYGVDKDTNKGFMRVYGDSYVGNRDESSYIKYSPDTGVEIKGKLITQSGRDIENTLNNFQEQIDGVKETFYGEYTPTLTNYPANEWTTEDLKNRHEGDVFTNIQPYVDDETTPDSGKSWRWVNIDGVWGWSQIADSDSSKAYYEAAKAAQAAQEAKESAINANNEVNDLKNFTNQAFADGIIDRSEAAAIQKYLNNIQSIQADVKESYDKVYNNPLLSGTAKVNLQTSYQGFNLATSELISAINDAIADGIATPTEQALVDGRYDTFNIRYGDFIGYLNIANKFIQDNINTKAQAAQEAAQEAQGIANAAKERLNQWADDGVISPTEKQSIKDEITRINADKITIEEGYTLYNLGEPIAYNSAYNFYLERLTALSNTDIENIPIPTDFANIQSSYYTQRTNSLNVIASATKSNVTTQLAGYEYLREAWRESTTIEGGVILNTLNMLGYTDSNNVFQVMSGMNGTYDNTKIGGGIAAWYGGDLIDRDDYPEGNIPDNAATSLIRMDGSGYLADGAIWWGTDGKFHADPQSFIINENQLGDYLELFQIIYKPSGEINYVIPQYSFQNLVIADYIELTNGIRLSFDSQNNSIKLYRTNGNPINFYATGDISSLGYSEGGGGSGGLIEKVYGYNDLGKSFDNSILSDTFNAYTINMLNNRIIDVETNGAINFIDGTNGDFVSSVVKNGSTVTINKSPLSNIADNRYVLKSGDTINGILTINYPDVGLVVNGRGYFIKGISVSNSVDPTENYLYDLGQPNYRWKDIYSNSVITNTLNINHRLQIDNTGKISPIHTLTRTSGLYGIYDPEKISHIWSLGKDYTISDDGTHFANLYGIAYAYSISANNSPLSGHQITFVQSGEVTSSIGLNGSLWTKNSINSTSVYATGLISGIRVAAEWDSGVTGAVSCTNWFRSYGVSGWLNASYVGGWYMSDVAWIRNYANKSLLISGYSNVGAPEGQGVGILLTDPINTSIELTSGRTTLGIGSNANGSAYFWFGTQTDAGGSSGKSYVLGIDKQVRIYTKQFYVDNTENATSASSQAAILTEGGINARLNIWANGNIVAVGEVIALQTSDYRLKTNFRDIHAGKLLLDMGLIKRFDYTDEAKLFNPNTPDSAIAPIYQTAIKVLPSMDVKQLGDKYGRLNFLDTNYINLIAATAQQNYITLNKQEKRIKELEKEVSKLKRLL